MGILSWVVMGLLVGAVAKFFMPGKDPGGIIVTILLGIAGAFVGGFVESLLGLGKVTGFNLGSFLMAVGGAILLLIVYRLFKEVGSPGSGHRPRSSRRAPPVWTRLRHDLV